MALSPAVPTPVSPELPLVSLIVPVYKVENYLPRCLESIAAQTYPNLDIILVDDGSPDASGEMCDQFARDRANVRVLHQPNQGQSVARNTAVPLATGEYVAFVDSDDYVEPDYIEYLLRLLLEHQADISVGGFVYEYEGRLAKNIPRKETSSAITPAEMITRMNYGEGYGIVPWGKLYRKELLLAHPYPPGKIYEDLATTCKIVGDARRIAVGNKPIYHWLQRPGSTMNNGFSARQLDGLEAARAQLDYTAARFPEALPSAKFRYTAKGVELAKIFLESGDADTVTWNRLRDHVALHGREVLRDPRTKSSLKLRIRAVLLGRIPARIAIGFHDWLKRKML